MTPERWQEIDQLFHLAREHDSTVRAAFLAHACNGDESLRQEVESLVRCHQESEDFIDEPAIDLAAEFFAGSENQLPTGRFVGHYRIVSLLGQGGMGEVYLAEDVSLGRRVALKRLPPQFTLDLDRVRRFEQEARAASALNHPNIVTIYEIGDLASLPFITTEFIDGQTLREHLATARLRIDEVLEVVIQVASALAAAHAAGIVHRDIKPENIMLRSDRIVKVLDFGLAKAGAGADQHGTTGWTVKTDPGLVMGTAPYMSPEQARGLDVDARADIWSLGVVLYELLTHRTPFVGETPSHVMVSLIDTEPLPLLTQSSPGSDELVRIVNKALRKNREERYQTAAELAFDLKRLKQAVQVDDRLRHSLETARFRAAEMLTADAAETSLVNTNPRTTSEYLIRAIKRNKLVAFPALAALTVLVGILAIGAYFAYLRATARGTAGPIHSLAVLPFTNETGNPDAEYLSDGVSESLINRLAQLSSVKVIARSSSFKYRSQDLDPQEIARALHVEAILSGRVSQRGDNLLISVELLNARDGTHIWGEQYNRKAMDLFALQGEISSEIAQKLRIHLTAGERQQLANHRDINPQAYELLLKGNFCRGKGGTENRKKAIEFYQQAIAIDPAFAIAYAELSLSYSGLINSNLVDQKEGLAKGKAAARKALELDEQLAEAHFAVADAKMNDWEWAEAEREINRAIELNPNLAGAHASYAYYLKIHGWLERAVAEAKLAVELDPLSPDANRSTLYWLICLGQADKALPEVKKLVDQEQGNPDLQMLLGHAYAAVHQYRDAIAAYREGIRLGDHSPDAQIYLGVACARGGERATTRAILKRLATGNEYVSPAALAILRIELGEREQAFALLETAYAAHDQQLIWLGSKDFELFRSDPAHFADLMRRVGLTP